MTVPVGRKNVQRFGGNAAGKDWSLESDYDRCDLIYACHAFSNDCAKCEGKTGAIKLHSRIW